MRSGRTDGLSPVRPPDHPDAGRDEDVLDSRASDRQFRAGRRSVFGDHLDRRLSIPKLRARARRQNEGDRDSEEGLHEWQVVPSGDLGNACRRQAVVPCAMVAAGGTPTGRDPSAGLEPVQGGIERPMLDWQHALRSPLDGVREGVTVGRAHDEDPKHLHVERALQRLAL